MNKKPEKDKMISQSISLDPDSHNIITNFAQKKGISISAVVRILIKDNLSKKYNLLGNAK